MLRSGRLTVGRSPLSTCTWATGRAWWLRSRIESTRLKPSYTAEQKRHILERLTAAEGLERYLHTKYMGQKRFSGEGGDTLIPVLDHMLQHAGASGVQETVIGMAHRGRLGVLVNTFGKMPKDLFAEFEASTTPHCQPAT